MAVCQQRMQRLGSIYTRHVNDRLGRDGALFRGRFHSRLITDDEHLSQPFATSIATRSTSMASTGR